MLLEKIRKYSRVADPGVWFWDVRQVFWKLVLPGCLWLLGMIAAAEDSTEM
jgi:hypothetical protein